MRTDDVTARYQDFYKNRQSWTRIADHTREQKIIKEVHGASVIMMHCFRLLTSCWIWLREQYVCTPVNQVKPEEILWEEWPWQERRGLCSSASVRKRAFEVWEAAERSLSRSQKEAGITRLLFSIFVVFSNKNGQTEKTGTPSHPFSPQQRLQLCPVHTWIPDKEPASCWATAGGLRATHAPRHKDTPVNAAGWRLLC